MFLRFSSGVTDPSQSGRRCRSGAADRRWDTQSLSWEYYQIALCIATCHLSVLPILLDSTPLKSFLLNTPYKLSAQHPLQPTHISSPCWSTIPFPIPRMSLQRRRNRRHLILNTPQISVISSRPTYSTAILQSPVQLLRAHRLHRPQIF